MEKKVLVTRFGQLNNDSKTIFWEGILLHKRGNEKSDSHTSEHEFMDFSRDENEHSGSNSPEFICSFSDAQELRNASSSVFEAEGTTRNHSNGARNFSTQEGDYSIRDEGNSYASVIGVPIRAPVKCSLLIPVVISIKDGFGLRAFIEFLNKMPEGMQNAINQIIVTDLGLFAPNGDLVYVLMQKANDIYLDGVLVYLDITHNDMFGWESLKRIHKYLVGKAVSNLNLFSVHETINLERVLAHHFFLQATTQFRHVDFGLHIDHKFKIIYRASSTGRKKSLEDNQNDEDHRVASIKLMDFFKPVGIYRYFSSGELVFLEEVDAKTFSALVPCVIIDGETTAENLQDLPKCIVPSEKIVSLCLSWCFSNLGSDPHQYYSIIFVLEDGENKYSAEFNQLKQQYCEKYNTNYDYTEIRISKNMYDLLLDFMSLYSTGKIFQQMFYKEFKIVEEECQHYDWYNYCNFFKYPHTNVGFNFLGYDNNVLANAIVSLCRERALSKMTSKTFSSDKFDNPWDSDPLYQMFMKNVSIVRLGKISFRFHESSILIDMSDVLTNNLLIQKNESSLAAVVKKFLPDSPYVKLDMSPILIRKMFYLMDLCNYDSHFVQFFNVDMPEDFKEKYGIKGHWNYSEIPHKTVTLDLTAMKAAFFGCRQDQLRGVDSLEQEEFESFWKKMCPTHVSGSNSSLVLPDLNFQMDYVKMDTLTLAELMKKTNTIAMGLSFASTFNMDMEKVLVAGNSSRLAECVINDWFEKGYFLPSRNEEIIYFSKFDPETQTLEEYQKEYTTKYYYLDCVVKKFKIFENEEPQKYDGALTMINEDKMLRTNVYSADFRSFYPSTIAAHNLSKSTVAIVEAWHFKHILGIGNDSMDRERELQIIDIWNNHLRTGLFKIQRYSFEEKIPVHVLISPYYTGPRIGDMVTCVEEILNMEDNTPISLIYSDKKHTYFSDTIVQLMEKRKQIKATIPKIVNPVELSLAQSRELFLKICVNAFYGTMGANFGDLRALNVSSMTTMLARETIQHTATLLECYYYIYCLENKPDWNQMHMDGKTRVDFNMIKKQIQRIRYHKKPFSPFFIKPEPCSSTNVPPSNLVFIDTDGVKLQDPLGIGDTGMLIILEQINKAFEEIYGNKYIYLASEGKSDFVLPLTRKNYIYFDASPLDVAEPYQSLNLDTSIKTITKGFDKYAPYYIKHINRFYILLVKKIHDFAIDRSFGETTDKYSIAKRPLINVSTLIFDTFSFLHSQNPYNLKKGIPANRHKHKNTPRAQFIEQVKGQFQKNIDCMFLDEPFDYLNNRTCFGEKELLPEFLSEEEKRNYIEDKKLFYSKDNYISVIDWQNNGRPEINKAKCIRDNFMVMMRIISLIGGNVILCQSRNTEGRPGFLCGEGGFILCPKCDEARGQNMQRILFFLYHKWMEIHFPRKLRAKIDNYQLNDYMVEFFRLNPYQEHLQIVNQTKTAYQLDLEACTLDNELDSVTAYRGSIPVLYNIKEFKLPRCIKTMINL